MTRLSIKMVGVKEVNKRLSNLRKYAIQVQNAPIPTLIPAKAIDESLELAREKYRTPSSSPHYPLRWKSQKQKIAVIIRLKEEGNLPYKRTGRLESAWSASIKRNTVTIANTARDSKSGKFIAPFVIAEFQQPFHKDTGWQKRSAKIEREITAPIYIAVRKEAYAGVGRSRNG